MQREQSHLTAVFRALTTDHLSVQPLSAKESALAQNLPRKLNSGECEAIALAQSRQAPLLSNDKRAIRYCQQYGIEALDLATLLNLLWVKQITTKKEVEIMILKMEKTEGLRLNPAQQQRVFTPRQRRHRKP